MMSCVEKSTVTRASPLYIPVENTESSNVLSLTNAAKKQTTETIYLTPRQPKKFPIPFNYF